jgi:hypothetical protein
MVYCADMPNRARARGAVDARRPGRPARTRRSGGPARRRPSHRAPRRPPPPRTTGAASRPTPAGPPGYGQPGYGQPGYGYGYPAGPPTDSSATAALVIAIVGFFICAPVGAIVALILANSAQKRIEASGGRLGGLEMARAARIIAIIELVLTAVLIVGGLIAIAVSVNANNY